jgi:hypothetical protein
MRPQVKVPAPDGCAKPTPRQSPIDGKSSIASPVAEQSRRPLRVRELLKMLGHDPDA